MPETKDLLLRKAVQEDWYHMYHNIWRHAESARYMVWKVTESEADAQSRMERTIAFQASHDHHWTVVEKASGQAIGWAGLEVLRPGVCGETGVAIGPAFTGRGYGKQILNALCDYARDVLGARSFVAGYREGNTASKRLQESCGFTYSHREEKTDPCSGLPYTIIYSVKEL